MEFALPLSDQDSYRLERRDLEIRNGKLHAEIWRLGRTSEAAMIQVVLRLRAELSRNQVRMRTLDHLMRMDRLRSLGLA